VTFTTQSARHPILRGGSLAIAVVAMLCAAGCVQRRMTIRSNPPGAFVYVDDYPIGVTPVSTDFVYYGTRKFRLVRDGFETLTVDQRVKAPWYEWFGIDFVSENLIPYNIRDEQALNFQMVPQQIPPVEQLNARAEELRASTQAQRYIPPPVLPPAVPPGAVVPPPVMAPPPAGAPYVLPPPGAVPAAPGPVITPGTRIPPPATGQPGYAVPPAYTIPAAPLPPATQGWQAPAPAANYPPAQPQGFVPPANQGLAPGSGQYGARPSPSNP